MMGSGVRLTRRLSIRPCTSSKRTVTGLNATPAIVQEFAMCLPACALVWFLSAVKVLIAVCALLADCAAESLLVNALAMPPLSMQPALRRLPTTLVMLAPSAFTVTLTVVECVKDPEVPVTVSAKVEGVTEGPTPTVNVHEDEPPFRGVTRFVLTDSA